jgi:hypothetical protein
VFSLIAGVRPDGNYSLRERLLARWIVDQTCNAASESALTVVDTKQPPAEIDGTATDATADEREAAPLVNEQIRKLAETDALSLGQSDELYAFMCECGCMKMIELPLAVYDADGAWIDGHRRLS